MLELKNIVKEYVMGEEKVTALAGVSIDFRESEFVAVLGHSGCGKTTLLNIIGGLDKSTSGDLIINGKSTKNYKDRDWDTYRNHTIGFVFQSYNLIPHQTVLQNVVLALSLSGVSKAEQKKRATAALEKVGLGDQLKKKPSELSGGQMQRVAIARAIVNDPDIILADEPTGALDSETSVQVMDILKEIAKDRLVVMVTHNPELAEQYATRIVRMSDGKVIGDSDPLSESELQGYYKAQSERADEKVKKPSMSFATSFGLSLKNLFTKKGRTILTAFAGSIGIIGIALIFAVSQGMRDYIDTVQEDTLSTYPLTIMSETADMSSMLTAFSTAAADKDEDSGGIITEKRFMSQIFAQIGSNDLKAFKEYLDSNMDSVEHCLNAVQYGYNIAPNVYTIDCNNEIMRVNPSTLLSSLMSTSISMMYSNIGVFNEMLDNRELLEEQYNVVAGKWPEKYDELVMVLAGEGSMSDFLAYALGFRDDMDLLNMFEKVMKGEAVEVEGEPLTWTYDDILNMKFKLINSADVYVHNEKYDIWEDNSGNKEFMQKLYDNAEDLKVVGIVCAKPGVSASALQLGLGYLPSLTTHVIENAATKDIVKAQIANPDVDVYSGRTFDDIKSDKMKNSSLDFNDMIEVDSKKLTSAFSMKISESEISAMVQKYMSEISSGITTDTDPAEKDFVDTMITINTDMLDQYISVNSRRGLLGSTAYIKESDVAPMISDFFAKESTQRLFETLESRYIIPAETFEETYSQILSGVLIGYVQTASGLGNSAPLSDRIVNTLNDTLKTTPALQATAKQMGRAMTEAKMQSGTLGAVGEMSQKLSMAFASGMNVDTDKIASAFKFKFSEEELMRLMQSYTGGDETATADSNLRELGYSDLNEPYSINIYLVDFAAKEEFIDFIEDYNDKMENDGHDEMVISYTDLTGVLMSSVKTVVDSITYVLIAFVAISLVVSSIMIGVITLISVQERTKEIGILRALGASKRNVSSMFNAETTIIGFVSGMLGVIITYLLCIPIDAILNSLTGIEKLTTHFPIRVAVVLVIISVVLTIISGFIPSRSAAKKDPVVALRTE